MYILGCRTNRTRPRRNISQFRGLIHFAIHDTMGFDFLKMFNLEGIVDNVKGYFDSKIQMLKLEAQEKICGIITAILVMILVLFLGMMTLVFFSLALGNYLNSLFNSSYIGFGILAVFFLILVIVVVLSKKLIYKTILNISGDIVGTKKKEI